MWVMHVNDMCIIGRNLYGCADLDAHERFSILFIELMCLRSNLVSAWKAMQFHRLHALTSSWYEIGVVCYLSNSHTSRENGTVSRTVSGDDVHYFSNAKRCLKVK